MISDALTSELVAAVTAQHRVLLGLRPLLVESVAQLEEALAGSGITIPHLELIEKLDAAAQLGYGALVKVAELEGRAEVPVA